MSVQNQNASSAARSGGIAILDFGSQYTQLIARRIREQGVYAELFAWNADPAKIESFNPRGFILSGGPNSVYDPDAPTLPGFVVQNNKPILGICYGMQLLTQAFGGKVAEATEREF